MGNEAVCRVEYDGAAREAKVLLETEEILVRGPLKLKIPFRDIKKIRADDGVLHVRWADHEARFSIGAQAPKWAEKIANPKSVIDKLGVKSGQKISIIGKVGAAFADDLNRKGADVSSRLRKSSDIIFLAVDRREGLKRLVELRRSLQPAGSIWIIRPKGTEAIKDADVIAAGKASGLVDVKVVRFSETHTAEKLVIPVTKR